MPWKSTDANRHTKKAATPKLRRMWKDVANSMLQRTGDDAAAIRAANSVVKKRGGK
jgi:hypothetical protein